MGLLWRLPAYHYGDETIHLWGMRWCYGWHHHMKQLGIWDELCNKHWRYEVSGLRDTWHEVSFEPSNLKRPGQCIWWESVLLLVDWLTKVVGICFWFCLTKIVPRPVLASIPSQPQPPAARTAGKWRPCGPPHPIRKTTGWLCSLPTLCGYNTEFSH